MIERFILQGMGVNCYIYYNENTKKGFMVDPGMVSDKVRDFVEAQNLKIEAILLTHGHGDHIMGVEYFRKLYKCPVYAHEAERDILEHAELNKSREIYGSPVELRDISYLKTGEEPPLESTKVQVLFTPGHSPGGLSYLTDEGLFSGDTLFKLGIGRYDLYGGDFDQLEDSIMNTLYELPEDTAVYPGHGVSTTIGYEMKKNLHFRK